MPRRGFTLIEMLLVLAVLAVMAGVVLPSVLRFSAEQGLKDAAEAVRHELDATRFRAIKTGLVQQFRFEPQGRRFVVLPFEQDAASAAPSGGGSAGGAVAASDSLSATPGHAVSGELAEGYVLSAALGALSAGETLPLETFGKLPDAVVLSKAAWSPPILFLPDGSAQGDAADGGGLRLTDPAGRFVDLSVRGLTGMTTAGPVRQAGAL